jgi:SAM-dependent methyltransferase
MAATEHERQAEIVAWFDDVYRRKGSKYLRPLKAYRIFLELLEAEQGQKLLDVACGTGVLLKAASSYTSELYGIDISNVALEEAKKSIPSANLMHGTAESLPYADSTFDLVTCLGSLERMLDLSKVLNEIKRVTKPSGKYCFMVRNSNTLSWKYFRIFTGTQRQQGHAGANTLQSWKRLFESHGFDIVDILPDQYPLQRRAEWRSLFSDRVDYRTPIRTSAPIEKAYEFIFLMKNER